MRRIPWTLLGYILAFVLIVAGINHGLSFIPGTDQWRGKRAVAKVEVLEDQVSTLTREAAGNAEIGQAVNEYHTREIVYRDLAHQAETEARTAPDAATPLSQERADRLRLHDQRVCDSAPVACATIDASAGRAGAVPVDGPAAESDAG